MHGEQLEKCKIYLYDGTFEGVLTAIFDAWNDKLMADICSADKYCIRLIDVTYGVQVDEKKAERIRAWIIREFGYGTLLKVYRALLTESEGCELKVFQYLKYVSKAGRRGCRNLSNSCVDAVNKLEIAFCNETHKMYGFLRFKELSSGILFAEIGTKYNQLEPLIVFFHDRLPGEKIIIHDQKRNLSAVCDGRLWYITSLLDITKLNADEGQEDFEVLWRQYLQALSIKERENYKLQRQMMPIRYRGYMTEFLRKETELVV